MPVSNQIPPQPLADNRRANACWFFTKKRTFESSDAGNEERNGGDQKQNPAGDFTDDYRFTVARFETVIG